MTCTFCSIVSGKLPSYTIYEDKNYLAFLDIFPVSPGHTLVIPKRHYTTVWEVPDQGEYFDVVRKVGVQLKKQLDLEFVDVCVFGRGVAHAHVRLHPYQGEWRQFTEEFGEKVMGTGKMIDPQKAAKMQQLIRL